MQTTLRERTRRYALSAILSAVKQPRLRPWSGGRTRGFFAALRMTKLILSALGLRGGAKPRDRLRWPFLRAQAHHEKIVGGGVGRDRRFGGKRAVEHVEQARILREQEALVVLDSDGVHGVLAPAPLPRP